MTKAYVNGPRGLHRGRHLHLLLWFVVTEYVAGENLECTVAGALELGIHVHFRNDVGLVPANFVVLRLEQHLVGRFFDGHC
jgi:hypothetical protein